MIGQNQISKIFFQIYKTNYLLMYRFAARSLSTTAACKNILKKNDDIFADKDDKGPEPVYLNKHKSKPNKFFLKSDPQLFADPLQGIPKDDVFRSDLGLGKTGQLTMLQGLQEFLQHPMTWDRNNGFINVLLGLTLFGYCFCFNSEEDKNMKKGNK